MAKCRFCGTTLTATMVDLGMSPLCESYLAADELNPMEPFYPLHVWVCDACFLVQLNEYVAPEEIFTEYAYFSSFSSTPGSSTPRTTSTMITDRLGARRTTASSSSWRATTATCCSTSSPRHPVPRHRAGGERRRAAAGARGRDRRRVLRRGRSRASSPQTAVEPIWSSATTCSPRSPTSTTSSPASRSCSSRRERRHIEFPHLHAPARGEPVRHDLPRALLLLLADQRRGDLRRPRHDDLRRRGDLDPRRVAAHLRAHRQTTSPAGHRARRSRCACARSRRGYDATRDLYGRFEEQVRETKRALLELLIGAQARRQARSPATARPARATRCSTTAASAPTSSTSRSTATRTSRAGSCPGTHIPIHPPERIDEVEARLHLDPAVELQGRDPRAARPRADMGRPVHRADPDATVVLP